MIKFMDVYFQQTDRHDITEILLKVALNTIPLTRPFCGNISRIQIICGGQCY